MRNILIVIKHEVITTLSSRSFWVMTFLFPALIVALTLGSQMVAQSSINERQSTNPLEPGNSGSKANQGYSYVDLAGLIKKIPDGLPTGLLNSYPDVASAQKSIEAGEIEWYVLIPRDYIQTRSMTLVQRTFNPMATTPESFFQYLLAYNLAGDPQIAPLLASKSPSTVLHDLAPVNVDEQGSKTDGSTAMIVAYATLFLFFMLISMSSSMMLSSVSKEKSNRVAEVLLLSLRPRELMVGKLLGLSILALLQMMAWVGGAMLFLNEGKSMLESLSKINLPPGFLAWAILFYLLGYLLYASMMGAIGTISPDLREAGQFTFALLLPLMIPLFLNPVFADAPNGLIATILSLIPLTAPTAMMTRLATASVPLWQVFASLAGLAAATYLVMLLAARFFRPETLLSNASVKWPQLFAELRHAVTGRG